MSASADNPFWAFSLRVYRRAGVAPACLRLQDAYDVDVNLMLYCCWRGSVDGAAMPRADIEAALRLVEQWRESVVRPLRETRRRMKAGYDGFDRARSDALRSEVKRLELEAERLQQAALFESSRGTAPGADISNGADAARQNVAAYLDAIAADLDQGAKADCTLILKRCGEG
jgi:uncharacterized protein (TIGR02444 family)